MLKQKGQFVRPLGTNDVRSSPKHAELLTSDQTMQESLSFIRELRAAPSKPPRL